MRFKLKEPLPFILSKDPVLEGTVHPEHGLWILRTSLKGVIFTQSLKRSEFERIVAANILTEAQSNELGEYVSSGWVSGGRVK